MQRFKFLLWACLAVTPLIQLASEETSHAEFCRGASHAAAAKANDGPRKYAPSREIDINHLMIDVTPDFKARTIKARAVIRFKPVIADLTEVRLDAVALTVSQVKSSAAIAAHQSTDDELIVTFKEPLPLDQEATLEVDYTAEPRQGIYFRTPEMGYKTGDTHLWTQGEPVEGRHWFPCFDHPNDKFTSEIICHVPQGMTVLSNGKLMGEQTDAGSGLVSFRWLQDKPHVSYLIALVAGYMSKVEDQYRDIPLRFYTPPSQIAQATNSFHETKDMMAFFEKEIGIPYPWAKYDQVCVDDFTAGGMENTSLTILTDRTLFTSATENLRDSRGLVAHELAHQWFGDLVTCKDWSHLWLNEGFATYYEVLYDEYKSGRAEAHYNLHQNARNIFRQVNDTNAIVRRDFRSPNDQFNYLAYPKGGWVLHMLRSQLGPDLYRRCVKTYLERHQFGNVVTDDLQRVIEELTGRSYDQFFDQWLYHAHHPELDISSSWDEKTKLAKVGVRQTQKLSSTVLLFRFPLTIRFLGKGAPIDRTVEIFQADEEFYFPLPTAPTAVRIDPEYTLLAKISFHPPASHLQVVLSDTNDVIGRLWAVEELVTKKDRESITRLGKLLQEDPFYAVRIAAASGLRSIRTPECLEALCAATKQPDARVRLQVIEDIGGFYSTTAKETLLTQLEQEKNPDIMTQAISALGKYREPKLEELFRRFLTTVSYRNALADAAISAMRDQHDPAYIPSLLEVLEQRGTDFQTRGYVAALSTLATLARETEQKDQVREFLLQRLSHSKREVQTGAINALGTLDDIKAIAALETFTGATGVSPQKTAADRAIAQLRESRKTAPELSQVRKELTDLQKENRDLRRDFDQLKKKFDAIASEKNGKE